MAVRPQTPNNNLHSYAASVGVAQPARVNWQDPKAIVKINDKIQEVPIEEEEKTAQEGGHANEYMPDSTRVNFFTSD